MMNTDVASSSDNVEILSIQILDTTDSNQITDTSNDAKKTSKRGPKKKTGAAGFANKTFLCEICGKVSKSYTVHYGHTQTHRKDKIYTCLICRKTFNTCRKLCRHRILHLGINRKPRNRRIKPYKCGSCDRSFRERSDMTAHELNMHTTVTDVTPILTCHLCNRIYHHPFLLSRHIKNTHSKSRNVSCHLCNNIYTRNQTLKSHLRTYHKVATEGPLKYDCHLCPKQFSSQQSLRRHIKLHNNEKPFKCSTCNKCFAQSGNLKAHENIHKNLKPYICPRCGKGFKQKSNLNTHKKKCLTLE